MSEVELTWSGSGPATKVSTNDWIPMHMPNGSGEYGEEK